MAYKSVPLTLETEEVKSIQLDEDGKDVVHFKSTNPHPKLKGPVAHIYRAAENLKGIPIRVPTERGAVADLPEKTIVKLIVTGKETRGSTPEKPSYFRDVYEFVVQGVSYPIDGGLSAARERVRQQLGDQSVPLSTPNKTQPLLAVPQRRLYELSDALYRQIGNLPADNFEEAILSADWYGSLYFLLEMSKVKDIGQAFSGSYEFAEFCIQNLDSLDAIKDHTKRRKLLVMAVHAYVKARVEDKKNHGDALNAMTAEVKPYLDKILASQ